MNMQNIKEIIQAFIQNPSATICTVCMAGIAVIYSDNREFIQEQQQTLKDISKTQQDIAVELREINTRLTELEHQQKK